MNRLNISDKNAVKNCFVEEGMIGEVVNVSFVHRDSLGGRFLNYLASVDNGAGNFYYKFKPQVYCLLYVLIDDYKMVVFAVENIGHQMELLKSLINTKILLSYKNTSDIYCW